jgi:maltose-binding protein MalE
MKKEIKVFCAIILVFCIIFTVSCARRASGEKLTLWIYDNGRIEVLSMLGRQFEAEYGIPVEVSLVDLTQLRTQFLLASGGADSADIAIIPHDNLGALVENAAVIEINLGAKRDYFLEPSLEGFTYNGRLYGMPLAVENIGFFYNPELVPVPPETWDDAIAITEELIRQGRVERMLGLPDALYNVYPIYDSFGATLFGRKEDGSLDGRQILVAEPGFVAGLEFLTNAVRRRLIPETIDWDVSHVLFESGRAPFVLTGPWALNRFKTAGVPYVITKFPAARRGGPPGNPFLGVQGLIISAASPRRLLAQSFVVDFIAREENMLAIFNAEQRPSAWKSIFETLGDEDTLGFNSAGINAVPMPSIPEMGYIWDAWEAAAALAFSRERTPAQALQNAKAQIESLIP